MIKILNSITFLDYLLYKNTGSSGDSEQLEIALIDISSGKFTRK